MKPDSTPISKNMQRIWSKEAEVFRRWQPQHSYRGRAVTVAIIRASGAKPGARVLDVACGSGEPSLTLAKVVAPRGGTVVAVDLAEEMLAIAEEYARQQGLTNIVFKQADAVSLPFRDESFDAVTCRNGVMFFSDAHKALEEVRRVLKPGSYTAFVAWGPVEQNPHWRSTLGVLTKYVDISRNSKADPFLYDDPAKLEKELEKARFEEVTSNLVSLPYPFPGAPELAYQNFFDTQSIMGRFDGVGSELKKKIRRESIMELKKYYNGKELIMDAVFVLATGRKGST